MSYGDLQNDRDRVARVVSERQPEMKLRGRGRRPGFTLVEMLVAMGVTLLMVLALIQMFRVVGTAVSDGRASIELASNVRSVTLRLQEDLKGLTVPVRPWPDEASALGYLEIVEGWVRDSMAAASPNSTIGDWDDRVMFTAYSTSSPFTGQIPSAGPDLKWGEANVDDDGDGDTDEADEAGFPGTDDFYQTMEDKVAEIAWWAVLDDANRNNVQDSGETFTLHRRQLLLRPDLNDPLTGFLRDPQTGALFEFFNTVTPADAARILNVMDISLRVHVFVQGGTFRFGLRANALSDLSRREFRFGRFGMNQLPPVAGAIAAANFPFYPSLMQTKTAIWHPGPMGTWGAHNVDDDLNGTVDDILEAGFPGTDDRLISDSRGQDLILSNCIGFDVRVFDPSARIIAVGEDTTTPVVEGQTMTPGDPGYDPRDLNLTAGQGAYVDLFYAYGGQYPNAPVFSTVHPYAIAGPGAWPMGSDGMTLVSSMFSEFPQPRSGMAMIPPPIVTDLIAVAPNLLLPSATYDTWSFHYERDGVDQDADGVVDQGTDGFSQQNVAVDAPAERETSPPYPVALRGVQIGIRSIERDTRTVRHSTVISDFTPE